MGGAETQARHLAEALLRNGVAVRVWSSTARDSFHPAETRYYPAGESVVHGVPVWRFVPSPADEQHIPRFFRHHPELLPPLERFAAHELRLLGTLLSSDELYAAIHADRSDSQFLFLPYAFPTTFWGALLAPQRSVVQTCLHDEPYARYSTYAFLFEQVRGLLCNSAAEAALVQRIVGLGPDRVHLVGEGIDLSSQGRAAVFRAWLHEQYPLLADDPLLLYVGRRDGSKNIPLLLAYMREYWALRGSRLRLLLIGPGTLDIPFSLDARQRADGPVLDLGFLADEQTKHDAYAAADMFVLLSRYESFSRVLMEAWLQERPAIVHRDCAVTADHCVRSGGGLLVDSFGAFAASLDLLLARSDIRQRLGERGRAYVLETCDWQVVAARTAALVLQPGVEKGLVDPFDRAEYHVL
ncbi:MAG: glycosyltransferase family 4 protein [Chloroflexaceae bacterium]|nr:glycosyltransferase family 4 protein [Chloroflexaceae bacterium]